jgi:threonine dehydratase
MHRISLKRIAEAARVIDPVFLNSPQFLADSLSDTLGCRLTIKVETLNPIRSFKGRGADFFFVQNAQVTEVVCASAGNFGQGMAYAARKRGAALTVFAAETANLLKLERMRALGATVNLSGNDFDAAKEAARDFAAAQNLPFVEDSGNPEFTEGAGSMAVELLQNGASYDALVIPLGNGAMLAGIARWVKAHAPATTIIGVCAAGAPAMAESWRLGRAVTTDAIATIADGIGVRVPVPEALGDLCGLIDDIVLVEDSTIIQAMKLIHEHVGVVTEPAGAVGVAALLTNQARFKGQQIATVLCGSNLTIAQMAEWL